MSLIDDLRAGERDAVREFGAFIIAALALLLSIASVGDANSADEAARENVLAADAFAWYQAKNIRQTAYELAVDDFRLVSGQGAELPLEPGVNQFIADRIAFYEAQVARYESEPDPEAPDDPLAGEGKVQLIAQALHHQHEVEAALQRNASFDYATVLSSFGIVLAAAGVMVASMRFILAAMVAGALTFLFLVNAVLGLVSVGFFIE